MLVLFYKRSKERPQRPLKIWLLDVSKQVMGGFEAHVLNLLIAVVLDGRTEKGAGTDECEWYFVNFSIDTSLGVVLNLLLLRLLSLAAKKRGWTALQNTGFYGDPVDYEVWAKQLSAWLLIIPLVKLVLLLFISVLIVPLGWYGSFALGWLQGTPRVELAVVMVLCPCAMNVGQYWVQDTFLKRRSGGGGGGGGKGDEDEGGDFGVRESPEATLL